MPSSFSDVESHVAQRIEDTPLQTEPFDHCVVDNVFPEDFLAAIHQHWPSEDILTPLPETGRTPADVYKERYVMLFDDALLHKLDSGAIDFWKLVLKAAMGKDVVTACYKKFQQVINARLRHLKGDIKIDPEMLVVSDRANYAIGPHSDNAQRLISMLYYLSPEQKYRPYGTSLYELKEGEHLETDYRHYPPEKFKRHSRIDYVPNRAVFFPRTPMSFHGVEPVDIEDCDRRLLIVNVRTPEGAL